MMFPTLAFITLLVSRMAQAQFPSAGGITVGQEICVYGFIMDNYCIELGTLLDAPSVTTLENPQLHSLHCLLDVQSCYESPFHILESPPDNAPDGTLYGTGWQVSDNTLLLSMGRAQGSVGRGCETCPGDGFMRAGLRAQVKGTVVTVDPPVLEVTQADALFDDVGCDGDETTPVETPVPVTPAPVSPPTTEAPVPSVDNATTPAPVPDENAAPDATVFVATGGPSSQSGARSFFATTAILWIGGVLGVSLATCSSG